MQTLSQIAAFVDKQRMNSVQRALLDQLASSDVPAVVEGMFYTNETLVVRPVEGPNGSYVILGQNDESEAGFFAAMTDGHVVYLGGEYDDRESRFVNSSVEFFLLFLSEWNGFIVAGVQVGEDEDAIIRKGMRIKRRLRKVDQAAFRDEESWWSRVYEEVEYGVLGPE
jgi:hypothetical protein